MSDNEIKEQCTVENAPDSNTSLILDNKLVFIFHVPQLFDVACMLSLLRDIRSLPR